jgi:membrane protease YdiL (CAAX protease family)
MDYSHDLFNARPVRSGGEVPADTAGPRDDHQPPSGHPLVAWAIITATCSLLVALHALAKPADAPASRLIEQRAGELSGKILLGSSELGGPAARQAAAEQLERLDGEQVNDEKPDGEQADESQPGKRLRETALAGELAGPDEALKRLDQLDRSAEKAGEPAPEEADARRLLRRLYGDYAKGQWNAPSLTADERQQLVERMGWYGRVALHPEQGPDQAERQQLVGEARGTAIVVFGLFAIAGLALLLGLGLLAAYVLALAIGKLQQPLTASTGHGGLYAETFAVWLLLYAGLSVFMHLMVAWLPQLRDSHLALSGGAMLLSLTALVWPVLRGVRWSTVREEIGWTIGRRPIGEAFVGLGTYLGALPLLVLSVLVVILLMFIRQALGDVDGRGLPTHPAIESINGGDWGFAQLIVLACLIAPLVEETMFRGVLYRQLRDATERAGHGFSVLVSALAVSFVFAAIHPQGLVALPPLMTLAFVFALVREWRGTLLPSMVAHGLNNLVVMTLLFGLMS